MAGPTYLVRAIKFKCVDESGPDWSGSDEPYWVFTARSGEDRVRSTRSQVFGGVDSGATRKFKSGASESIMWPEKGDANGEAGPIALSIQLWESDQGDPNETVAKTAELLGKLKNLPVIGWLGELSGPLKSLHGFIADDIMGSKNIHFPLSTLRNRLPTPGSSFTQTYRLGERGGDLPFSIGGAPDYDLDLRVERIT